MRIGLDDIVTMFVAVVLAIHFYGVMRKRNFNKHNKCARCGVYFLGIEKISFTASYSRFFFCRKCIDHIKTIDKYVLLLTCFCMFLIVIAYFYFIQVN